jgi:predicted hydrolase (HD superfamily)
VIQTQAHVPKLAIGRAGSGNMKEKVSRKVSDAILKKMGYKFDPKEFHMGMNVEMEHKDVTNGNVVTTAKIAAAHLTENPKYYTLLKKYVEK